jgi:RNA polymerase sigma factor (sigma-70 family)
LQDFCNKDAIKPKFSVLNNMKQSESRTGSLKSFFEWNYLKLKNYARKQLGDRSSSEREAEEILHDVAVNLLSRFDLDATVENLAAYIYRSIRNRITDYRRRKKEEIPVAHFTDEEGNDLYMYIPDDAPIEAIMDGMEDHPPEDLEYALSLLSPEERELIIENEFNGRTFAELSKEWGISIGTLMSRKHRALERLHKILKART